MVAGMEFSVRTQDVRVLEELSKSTPAGISISEAPGGDRRGVSESAIEAITIIVTITQSIALNMIASWLYDSLKNRTKSVRIKGVDFPPDSSIDKADVERAIRDE
jgi:hypothetical protein